MKTKKYEPQTDKKRQCEGNKYMSPKKDNYSLPEKGPPQSHQGLSVQPHRHHTVDRLSSQRRGTGWRQPSGAGSEEQSQHRRYKHLWQFRPGFSGRDQRGSGIRWGRGDHWSIPGGSDQGHHWRCFRDHPFRQRPPAKNQRHFRGRGRGVKNRGHFQGQAFRGRFTAHGHFRQSCFHSEQSDFTSRRTSYDSSSRRARSSSIVSEPQVPVEGDKLSESVKHCFKSEENPCTGELLKQTTGVADSQAFVCTQPHAHQDTCRRIGRVSRWDILPTCRALTVFEPDKEVVGIGKASEGKASHLGVPSLAVSDSNKACPASGGTGKGKASRWDVSSSETTLTLRLPDSTKESKESERTDAEGGESAQPQGLSGSDHCPNLLVSQILQNLKELTERLPEPADASAVLIPSQGPRSSRHTLNNPQCTESSEKKASAFICSSEDKEEKLKELDACIAVQTSAIQGQKQEESGKVTERYLNTDGVDIELVIKPPAARKTHRRKLHQLYSEKTEASEFCKIPQPQKASPSVESFQGSVPQETPDDDSCHHDVMDTGIVTVVDSHNTATQKEQSTHSAGVDCEQFHHQPTPHKRIVRILNKKGKTPKETAGHEPISSSPTVEPTPHRRIVKVKAKQQGSDVTPSRSIKPRLPSAPSPSSGHCSSERRLIKVKSHQEPFKAFQSPSSPEELESETCQVPVVESSTNEVQVNASAEVGSENETAAVVTGADELGSDALDEHTQTKEFDFSDLFPHSQAEGRYVIDFLAYKCSKLMLSSVETDREAQHKKWADRTHIYGNSQNNLWHFIDHESYFQRQFEASSDSRYLKSDYKSASEEADWRVDFSNVPEDIDFECPNYECPDYEYQDYEYHDYECQDYECHDYECHDPERIYSEDLEEISDLSLTDEVESGGKKKIDPQSGVFSEKSEQTDTRQPRINIPFVKKAKKDSLTSVNQRDKLKALFSVRKKGGLKLMETAKADPSAADKLKNDKGEDKCVGAAQSFGAPSVAEYITDIEQITGSAVNQQSHAAEAVCKEEDHSSMADRTAHGGGAVPVNSNSEQCEQDSHTHRERHVSSDCSDLDEQSYQTDVFIDDDEILREIDSCLETDRPSLKVQPDNTVAVKSEIIAETNSVREETTGYSSCVGNYGLSKQMDLSEDGQNISKENVDTELCSDVGLDESIALTAVVKDLTMEDNSAPGSIIQSGKHSHIDGKPQPVHISLSINTASDQAVSGQVQLLDHQGNASVQFSEKMKSIERNPLQMAETDQHGSKTVSVVSSLGELTDNGAPPCVRLEQDSSGTTDISIVMDITGHTVTGENGTHGNSSSTADSSISPASAKQSGSAERGAQNEEEFVTTCFSLLVPRNKSLELSFEPMVNLGACPDDKNIEIEVTAESGSSMEDLKLVQMLNLANLCAGQSSESKLADTSSAPKDSSYFLQDPQPQDAELEEVDMDQEVSENLSNKIGWKGNLKASQISTDKERELSDVKAQSEPASTNMQKELSAPEKEMESAATNVDMELSVGSKMETESGASEGSELTSGAEVSMKKSSSDSVMELRYLHSGPPSSAAIDMLTASADMLEKEGMDHSEDEGIEDRHVSAVTVTTAAVDSSPEDRIEDGEITSETCDDPAPLLSVTAEIEKNERSPGNQSPSSPPRLTHYNECNDGTFSSHTSSPPVLKPQAILPASEHLPCSSSPFHDQELTDSESDLLAENSSTLPTVQSSDPARFGVLTAPDQSQMSSEGDCASSLVASPVESEGVEVEGGGGCVDVVSEDEESGRTSCSPPGLFSALRTFKLARVSSTTAMEDKTDLDPSHSDHDENRSPKSPISDDSDDSLGDEPAFLSSVLGGSTPLSTVNTNMFAQDGQGLLGETTAGTRCRPTTFSLDSLLRDTKKHEAEEQKTIAMQEKLRKELLSGKSYSQEENESDEMDYENFTDEQKRTLKELRLEEEEIRDIAPGESVLSDPALGQLFTETVSPAACGVHIGASHACLRRLFDDYQPASLMDILSSDIISLTYHSLPCKPQIQRWLFFIMSVHSSVMEVRKCVDQLHQVLQWQMGDVHQTPTWTPPLLDLFRVFVNWGADLKDLVFDSSTIDQHELEQVLPLEGSVPWPVAPAPCHRNFEAVLKMLVSWLQARPGYSSQELNQLLLMLCRLSLDHSLCKMYILTELQMCLASILECYQPSEWNSVVPWLCRQLSQLSSHHHNQVYITKLLSSVCPRSRYLQQRLAYLLLHSALTSQPLPDTHLHQFQLADLVVLIPEFKQVLHKDSYHVASLVHLLDLSVGPAAHHVSQKKQLFRLLEAVRLIVSEIRDSMQRLDCTKVKGMLLHLCLKWDLAVKASNVKQRKIFSCFSSATKVQVEQLKDQGNAANDDNTLNDSSTSFSDDDLSNEEDTTPASTKVLKQDSGSDSTVKRDERPDHSRAKKRRDRSGVAEPSDCRRSGDRSCVQGSDGGRVGIFDVLNPSGAGDVPSGGDNSDVIKTARCRVAGTGVSGDHHSPVAADRDRVSEMCDSAGSGGGDAVRSVLPDTRTPGTSQPRLADSDTSALSNTDRLKVPDTNRSTESGRDRCRVTGMQRSRLSSDSDPEGTSDPDSADDSLPEL